jgi:hypothetical protein
MKSINTKSFKGARFLALFFITAGFLTAARAQGSNGDTAEQLQAFTGTPKVLNVWPGLASGSEGWKQKETTLGSGPMQRICQCDNPDLDGLSAGTSEGDRNRRHHRPRRRLYLPRHRYPRDRRAARSTRRCSVRLEIPYRSARGRIRSGVGSSGP